METYIAKLKDDKLYLYNNSVETGLISPEATWVKEGDEFEEKDIDFQIFVQIPYTEDWYESVSLENYVKGIPDDESYSVYVTEKRIRIKGPCGHFH